MKKSFLFMVTVFLLSACSSFNSHHKQLEKQINDAIEASAHNEVVLNTLTDFDWEKAVIFTPYTTEESMSEQLGFKFKDRSNLSMRDDILLLVFVNEGKAVQYVELGRHNTINIVHDNPITFNNSKLKFGDYN